MGGKMAESNFIELEFELDWLDLGSNPTYDNWNWPKSIIFELGLVANVLKIEAILLLTFKIRAHPNLT